MITYKNHAENYFKNIIEKNINNYILIFLMMLNIIYQYIDTNSQLSITYWSFKVKLININIQKDISKFNDIDLYNILNIIFYISDKSFYISDKSKILDDSKLNYIYINSQDILYYIPKDLIDSIQNVYNKLKSSKKNEGTQSDEDNEDIQSQDDIDDSSDTPKTPDKKDIPPSDADKKEAPSKDKKDTPPSDTDKKDTPSDNSWSIGWKSVAVVILAIAAGGGILIYKNNNKQDIKNNNEKIEFEELKKEHNINKKQESEILGKDKKNLLKIKKKSK